MGSMPPPMGQPITVVEKPSTANPAILRLETNRPLSGMGHERYTEPPGELMQRPVDELARRLFAKGGVEGVHVNGSVVTVTLRGGRTGEGLGDVVRQLFLHYGDTPTDAVAVPLADADAAPESLTDSGDAPSAQASADDAPAPDRPPAEEGAAQQIEGIPNAELEPQPDLTPEREASPADPEDIDAAVAGEPTAETTAAQEDADAVPTPPVDPTPDVERPVAEPLEADPADVEADDAAEG